ARTLRRRHPRYPELPQVPRKCGLRNIPIAPQQQLPEVFLAHHWMVFYGLQDGVLTLALVGHSEKIALPGRAGPDSCHSPLVRLFIHISRIKLHSNPDRAPPCPSHPRKSPSPTPEDSTPRSSSPGSRSDSRASR